MIDYMVGYFKSFFQNPSASGIYLVISIGLAIGFGAVWLTGYWPQLIKKPWLWAVLVSSAFLTVVAVCFIQTPLQIWTGQALMHFWSQEVLERWILGRDTANTPHRTGAGRDRTGAGGRLLVA